MYDLKSHNIQVFPCIYFISFQSSVALLWHCIVHLILQQSQLQGGQSKTQIYMQQTHLHIFRYLYRKPNPTVPNFFCLCSGTLYFSLLQRGWEEGVVNWWASGLMFFSLFKLHFALSHFSFTLRPQWRPDCWSFLTFPLEKHAWQKFTNVKCLIGGFMKALKNRLTHFSRQRICLEDFL